MFGRTPVVCLVVILKCLNFAIIFIRINSKTVKLINLKQARCLKSRKDINRNLKNSYMPYITGFFRLWHEKINDVGH